MTRQEIIHWAQETVARIFHGHHKTATIQGWLARDKSGGLRLWRVKPAKETNFDFGECWGYPCEMGAWIRIDASLFPQVKWEDAEPTPVTIKIEIESK